MVPIRKNAGHFDPHLLCLRLYNILNVLVCFNKAFVAVFPTERMVAAMAFTDNDLKEMMDDCIVQVKRLGYDLYPILDIKFSPGAKNAMAYIRPDINTFYDPYKRSFVNVKYHIRVHGMFKELGRKDYMNLKSLVMHEVIHAIVPDDPEEAKFSPGTVHNLRYLTIKNRIEKEYGYKHIYDRELKDLKKDRLWNIFKEYYRKRGIICIDDLPAKRKSACC